ncbi:MAG: ABC transporter ATP-binding protein [Candidatus Omnitrophota bacterium]|nr:MAG: ABC transporter ATP-binding protein [Candidatus Omnitrophota bacterium]
MLKIENLVVEVAGHQILKDVNLEIKKGETFVLFGPNGSGKTTLLMSIMGFPKYKITQGKIFYQGKNITRLPLDERARLGLGIMFQRPPTIHGVTLKQLIGIYANDLDVQQLGKALNLLSFFDRDINADFSGGEIKRSEILQLFAQKPNIVLLDEPASGVDIENICLIGKVISQLLQHTNAVKEKTRSGLIITHTGYILDYVKADKGCVMINGKIVCHGEPHSLLRGIHKTGYQECIKCLK